jgi:hypothetical protein
MLPIPGTSKAAHLEENLTAAGLRLSAEEMERADLSQSPFRRRRIGWTPALPLWTDHQRLGRHRERDVGVLDGRFHPGAQLAGDIVALVPGRPPAVVRGHLVRACGRVPGGVATGLGVATAAG